MKTPERVSADAWIQELATWRREHTRMVKPSRLMCKTCGSAISYRTAFVSLHAIEFGDACTGPGKVEQIEVPYCASCEPAPAEIGCWHMPYSEMGSRVRNAQDDPELIEWLLGVTGQYEPKIPKAGDFLRSLAEAALRADAENYPQLRPVLLFMKAKYPQYGLGDRNKESDTREARMKARHLGLHRVLDELIACWLMQQPTFLPSNASVEELIRWSYAMTHNPTCAKEH